jgi:hypothetical protein
MFGRRPAWKRAHQVSTGLVGGFLWATLIQFSLFKEVRHGLQKVLSGRTSHPILFTLASLAFFIAALVFAWLLWEAIKKIWFAVTQSNEEFS